MSEKRIKPKKHFRWRFLFLGILLFIIYEFIGVMAAYGRHPKVSEEYKESFDPESCYSDTPSTDRARVIEDNLDALNLRIRMINNAKERVILSTYDFHSDRSGQDVMSTLIEAAKRGVKVQIVVDGFSGFLEMDRNPYFFALASQENVEIKIYNRLNVLKPWKTMGRLHDKYLIVDDNKYLMGGRNTFNIFLGDYGYKNYDREVMVYTDKVDENSSIHQVEAYFDSMWNLENCKTFKDHSVFVKAKKTEEAEIQLKKHYDKLMADNPELKDDLDYESFTFETDKITLLSNPIHVYAKEPTVFYALTELMKTTDGPVRIHTPYVICNNWMYDSYREVCENNDQITMMTNSVANNGNPFGASDYNKNRHKLLETGLNIREYEGGVSYHGKSLTIGDELSVIGSFNMDMRSAYLDTELMLVIDSKEINAQLQDYMDHYESHSVGIHADGTYDIPEGVHRQELTKQKAILIKVLTILNWLRFLM